MQSQKKKIQINEKYNKINKRLKKKKEIWNIFDQSI